MKIIKKILSGIMIVLVALAFVIVISSVATKGNNYGCASFFGYQPMVVVTDSMEPTLPVGTGVIVKKVDTNTLVKDDIISFYKPNQGIIVTHRIVDVKDDSDGNRYYECFGDNLKSNQCPNSDCNSAPRDIVYPKYILGKVICVSNGVGKMCMFFTNSYVRICLFVIPIAYLLISSIVEKAIKESKKEGMINEQEK